MHWQCSHARHAHRVQLPPGVKYEPSPQSDAQPGGLKRDSPAHCEAQSAWWRALTMSHHTPVVSSELALQLVRGLVITAVASVTQ